MRLLKSIARGRHSGWIASRYAQRIDDELTRLRRIERKARALVEAAKYVDKNYGFPFGTELKDAEAALKPKRNGSDP